MERVYATTGLRLNGIADDGAVNTISELMRGEAGAPVRAGTAECTEEVEEQKIIISEVQKQRKDT